MGLLAANLLVLNLGLGLTPGLRADLTEWDEYSISPVTESLIRGASEPLLVRGYFSDRVHPLLDPLVPRIRDFLEELQAVGGADLTAQFVDPTRDEELEREAKRDYDIASVPFHFADRHADSVVNAYFHILVRYGDRHEVLDYRDLIDVEMHGTDIKVRLRNLEYDVARAIQKVVFGFKSLESICKQLPAEARLEVIASSKNLPQQLASVPSRVTSVAEEIKRRCSGRFDFTVIDPDEQDSGVTPESLYRDYGIKPLMVGLFDQRAFYLDLVLNVGDQRELLSAAASPSESEIRSGLEAALQRHVPGFLKSVGVAAPEVERPPYPGMPPRNPSYELLEKHLRDTYEVVGVDLKSGRVPGRVDVLLVLGPEDLSEREIFALDQFLMRGGSTIIATGSRVFSPMPGGGLATRPSKSGISDLLETWGVAVGDDVVLDEHNAAFPVPVERNLGGGVVLREIRMVDYPPFVLVTGEGLRNNPAAQALPQVVMHWPSSVSCVRPADAGEEAEAACQPLLTTTDRAWQQTDFDAQPDYDEHPELGFAAPEKRRKVHLAVAFNTRFSSFFAGKQAPLLDEDNAEGDENKGDGIRAGLIERSPDNTRLVVLGSANFVSDMMLSLSEQISDAHLANLQLITNLVDWAVEDAGLLQIRSKERSARTLEKLEDSEKIGWEAAHFGFVALAVLIIGLATLGRRGRARPIRLVDPDDDELKGGWSS